MNQKWTTVFIRTTYTHSILYYYYYYYYYGRSDIKVISRLGAFRLQSGVLSTQTAGIKELQTNRTKAVLKEYHTAQTSQCLSWTAKSGANLQHNDAVHGWNMTSEPHTTRLCYSHHDSCVLLLPLYILFLRRAAVGKKADSKMKLIITDTAITLVSSSWSERAEQNGLNSKIH
jgi:hypothetical protein